MKETQTPRELARLIELVAAHYRLNKDYMVSKSRKDEVVKARQMYCVIAFKRYQYRFNMTEIGNAVGYSNHSNTSTAIRVCKRDIEDNWKGAEEHYNALTQLVGLNFKVHMRAAAKEITELQARISEIRTQLFNREVQ